MHFNEWKSVSANHFQNSFVANKVHLKTNGSCNIALPHKGLKSPKRFTNLTTSSGMFFPTSAYIVSPRVKKGGNVENIKF